MKKTLAAVLVLVSVALVTDLLASYGLFYFLYGGRERGLTTKDFRYTPTLTLLRFAARRAGQVLSDGGAGGRSGGGARVISSTPSPFYVHDPVQGYGVRPGSYEIVFSEPGKDKPLRWRATIEDDGGRATAPHRVNGARTLYVFGDSWVFGWGVDDEMTAAWQLQTALRDAGWAVRSYAQGGYGTVNELISFRALRERLGPDDVLVLPYAYFYRERNVASPSRVRALSEAFSTTYVNQGNVLNLHHARGRLRDGRVEVDSVNLFCAANDGYCEQPDPSGAEQEAVTIAMFDEMLDAAPCRVLAVFLRGADEDGVVAHLRSRGAEVIDARAAASPFFVRDTIYGYNNHPGPLFHLHLARLLLGALGADRAWPAADPS